MHVLSGDVVRMRDGRIVEVTDAADRDPRAYPGNLPVETIFVGNRLSGGTVVSDMSEVVEIIGGPYLEWAP